MIKQNFINFLKNFKYFFICFGIIVGGIALSVLIFILGSSITLSMQSADTIVLIKDYLKDLYKGISYQQILSLSILKTMYFDIIKLAGEEAIGVKIGLAIVAILSVYCTYWCYKGSVGLVNYLNKRKLRNEITKRGFKPFVIKLIIGFGFSIVLVILLSIWKWSSLFVLLIYLIVDSFQLLVNIHYIFYSNKNLKSFLQRKNHLAIMGLYLLSQVSLVIIAAILWTITPLISIFIIIPLLAYSETNVQYTVVTTFKTNEQLNLM